MGHASCRPVYCWVQVGKTNGRETKSGTRIKATGSHRKDTLECKADPYCWCVIEIKKEKATINRNFSALKYVLPK